MDEGLKHWVLCTLKAIREKIVAQNLPNTGCPDLSREDDSVLALRYTGICWLAKQEARLFPYVSVERYSSVTIIMRVLLHVKPKWIHNPHAFWFGYPSADSKKYRLTALDNLIAAVEDGRVTV